MARFKNGWIKAHRKILECDIHSNPILQALWESLRLMATWEEQKIVLNGKQRILPPGTVVFGLREFASRWNCSISTIHKWVHYLEETGRITLDSTTHGCIATICNWEEYQLQDADCRTPTEHEANTNRTPTEHQPKHNEEGKKVRKKEYIYTSEFETFWAQYPDKRDKQQALRVFKAKVLPKDDMPDLLKALAVYVADCQENNRFFKHPKTFLGDWKQWLTFKPPSSVLSDEERKRRIVEVCQGAV